MTRPSGDPSISNGSGRAASAAQFVSWQNGQSKIGRGLQTRLFPRETGSSLDFGKWCCWQGGLKVCTWRLLIRQTELSVRVLGKVTYGASFAGTGQTAGKKYQLMQEQQSPACSSWCPHR